MLSKRSLIRWLALLLTLVYMLPCGFAVAEDTAGTPAQVMLVWTDEFGEEQNETVRPSQDESGVTFVAELPVAVAPALTIFQAYETAAEGEPSWMYVDAEAGYDPEGTPQFTWLTDAGEQVTLLIYLSGTVSEAEDQEPAAPVETPSGSVTIIVHYQTADGTSIAEDETYMGLRGTAVPLYAKTLDEEWTLVSDPLQYLDVSPDAPDVLEASFIYIKPTPTPAPPEVRVIVHYRDVGGVPVASDTVIMCPGGCEQTVVAAPEDLKENYYPTSESVQQVQTNSDGVPQEIIFFYTYRAPATPAPAYVVIRYEDAEGNAVAEEGQLTGSPGQEMTVYAAPEQLLDFYELDDTETKQVTLPESGAAVTVTFRYRLELPETPAPTDTPVPEVTPTPQPARAMGFVQVSYVYQGDSSLDYSEPITVYEGQTELSGADGLRAGYRLISAETVTVTLSADGRAEPNQVTFVYTAENGEVAMPELIVQYFAEDGTQIATSTLMTLHLGENTVFASPVDLREGYEQLSPSFTVNVDEQGHADADLVTFYYKKSSGSDA